MVGVAAREGWVGRLEKAEKAAVSLLPRRARRGSTSFGRLGDVVQQPPVWAALAALLAVGGGARGKRAAARGVLCFSGAAVVANLVIKPFVGRSRPPRLGRGPAGTGHLIVPLRPHRYRPRLLRRHLPGDPGAVHPAHRHHHGRPLVHPPQPRALPERRASRRGGGDRGGGGGLAAVAARGDEAGRPEPAAPGAGAGDEEQGAP